MSSRSLDGIRSGIAEVKALRSHYAVPRGAIPLGTHAVAAKAHGRACVVLLSSHLERYVRSINEESIEWLNFQRCDLGRFPPEFLLTHSRVAVDDLAMKSWEKRGPTLKEFVSTHGRLWSDSGTTGDLQHQPLLSWMKSPKPDSLKRFYRVYGIPNIFDVVTRQHSTKSSLYLGITELVEKRNNIAHGDYQTEALPVDVTKYLNAVDKFASSADKCMARSLRKIAGTGSSPW